MPDKTYRRRTAGSVRFDPYYKLDRYDDVSMCWRPVGRAYATLDDVRRAVRVIADGARYRALHVTMRELTPVEL